MHNSYFLSLLEKNGGKIFLYQSKDDSVVPFVNVEKYAKELPNAEKVSKSPVIGSVYIGIGGCLIGMAS
jgi:hypothetical protein